MAGSRPQAARQDCKRATTDITVNEMLVSYLPHAERHYRHADGAPTKELQDVKISLRPLKELYGTTRARDFGPLARKSMPLP
jgi:hypothetical protein